MTTEVGCGEAVWMTGQRRWGQWGGGSGPPLDGSRVQAALGDSQCLAPPLTLSFAAGCAQSEVHRLFRVSVSGFPLGKDGKNGGEGCTPRAPPQPAGLEEPASWAQLALLSPSPPPPAPPCSPQSLTVVFREPFPVQPQDSESPPAQLVSTYHHLESVINTACFTLWTRLL